MKKLIATALCCAATAAWSQDTRSLQMLVNFPAGASTDIMARVFGETFKDAIGRPVVVMNKGGAFGTIGVAATANAPADGNTVGFVTSIPITLQPLLIKDVSYTLADLTPICRVNDVPTTLVASPKSGFERLSQLVERARREPGKINLGVPGLNSGPHLAMMMFMEAAKIDMLVAPHQSDNNAVQPLQSGDLDVAVAQPSFGITHGFKVLAVSSAKRMSTLPDVPTLTEMGFPAVQSVAVGLVGPKGMPPNVVRSMEAACKVAFDSSRFQDTMKKMGQAPSYANAAEFTAQLAEEARVMKVLAQRMNLMAK